MTAVSLDAARQAIADAVTGAGLECVPYPPDTVNAPLGWVDSIRTDYNGGESGGYFCAGVATARVLTVAQRHDKPAAVAHLEGLIPAISAALAGVPGLRLLAADSGVAVVGTQDLPSVLYTVQFHS